MESLRVWLEPGYDQGRTGAWLLDWPGAFTYGATRDIALGRVISAAHRFADWLSSHGDVPSPVPAAVPEVVDEVAAETMADGYVVNATFGPDHRPVDADEIEAHLRRLEYARVDLLGVMEQIRQLELPGGTLPSHGDRKLDEVLHHLAGSETWFVSRLDAGARYQGPRDDTDTYLAESRAFLADGLRRLVADAVAERVDGKGETWTLAKVVRRSLYHSLDHLDELDRRLAAWEGRIDRIELRHDELDLDPDALRTLFAKTGFLRRAQDGDDVMARMLSGSTLSLTAWDGDALVGFVRLISDEATNGYVTTVAVAPRWQDRGLGSRLMRELMRGREHLKIALESAQGAEEFYERLGFERSARAFVRRRGVS